MNLLGYLRFRFSKKKQLAQNIKNIVGFYPSDVFLFERSLVHKSVVHDSNFDHARSNERLEFLGDAILGSVAAQYLFEKFPNENEGTLTKLRSRMVSRNNLNETAVKIGLDKLVIAKLDKNSTTQSIYGNAFEALVGAVYLDQGYYIAHSFILDLIKNKIIDVDKIVEEDTNFKSKVIEWSQKEKIEVSFEIIEEKGEGRNKEFVAGIFVTGELKAQGKEHSKKKAEQLAAEQLCAEYNL